MYFKLKKPSINLDDGSQIFSNKILKNKHLFASFSKFFTDVSDEDYLFWDDMKFRNIPEGLTAEECWTAIKFFRKTQSKDVRTVDSG